MEMVSGHRYQVVGSMASEIYDPHDIASLAGDGEVSR
jgi:hypothetical protein